DGAGRRFPHRRVRGGGTRRPVMSAWRVARKWRPSLRLLTFAAASALVALPLLGLVFIRLDENHLDRQTEESLIAQAALLSSMFAREVEALREDAIPLGATRPPVKDNPDAPWTAIDPELDLARSPIREPRPDPREDPATPPSPAALEVGARLY